LGLIFGFIIGVIGSAVLNQYIITNFESLPSNIQVTVITPVLLIEVTIITMIIALLASLGPIYWAGKVNPADTIRME
jgi:ABC-type lipoprotein release transport system permease subunit